ncbi:transposase [Bradyrhizobium elkanii]|jgi:transposase|uniref:transposase n=1 Tax=Bradyrhizobium elkanii TaxID=29448 RepID=UPI002A0D3733|nr:transposase [Bradyrhizobium elkanii]MCS3563861.1 transposase [Bradyrhizobium elkanii]MCW2146304.1 transposase [Bradyrhizobium elkanii]MCW2354623.1 transposase [Bradyrhizobium elkanii]MCW2379134.1 transposase [Bradyrhizobium elkanii]
MQVNVLGAERRRRWSYDEKVRLVEETLQPGETVCGVARRHGVAHSLLFTWYSATIWVGSRIASP